MCRSCSSLILALGVVLGATSMGNATIIGFANTAGSNAKVPASLGSYAAAEGYDFTVSNGATPNIGVEFVFDDWDYHHSGHFAPIENLTMGGAWDNDGTDPDIAQVEHNGAPIVFTADPGYALVLNSFDFGLSDETVGQTNDWTLSLTDSSSAVVWSTSITLLNEGSGDVRTIEPNFVGANGMAYTLTFDMTAEGDGQSYGTGRNALDNVSFNQIAVPEPTSVILIGLGVLGFVACRRRAS